MVEACWDIICAIIKAELKKGYQEDINFDGNFLYVPDEVPDGIQLEEVESFKLDESESVSISKH